MNSKTILAIDTSCDDTAVAVTKGNRILSNVIASQTELHKKYGGVFPTVAKQAHKENIVATTQTALQRAQVQPTDLTAVAVTQGPGLAPALEVGIQFAKKFATEHNLALYAINHIEGHLLSVLAQPNTKQPNFVPKLPALAVIVSGGHTQFVWVKRLGKYQILGATLDDAAGECLDKIGRMLGLGYPAGAVIEEFAKKGDPTTHVFPLPMTHTKEFNLSFSGLKTFARNTIEEAGGIEKYNQQDIFDFCASAQYGVFRHICYKLEKILQEKKPKELWLGGGVAANSQLRKMLRTSIKNSNLTIPLRVPYTKRLCQDNAGMIGIVVGLTNKTAVANLETVERKPRWGVEFKF